MACPRRPRNPESWLNEVSMIDGEINMTDTGDPAEKKQQSRLNLICLIAAALFLALVGYNLFAAGAIISTDGLFFTVVPLVLALAFLAVPGLDMLANSKQGRGEAAVEPTAAAAHETAHEHAEEIHFAGSN